MEITKESLLKKLNDMKRVACDPDNYIYEFFSELRTQVDLETETKQIEAQGNEEIIANLHQINEQIISKINEFEKNYKNTRCDLEANKLKINEIEKRLNNNETIEFKDIEEEIEIEEYNLLKNLFQNKTIAFMKPSQQIYDKL